MADATIDSENFVLFDNWPGVALANESVPADGFTGAGHHNVTTPAYPLGTKIQVYNTGLAGDAGYSIFIYLKGLAVTAANPTCAAKQIVVPALAGTPYQVTNDPDNALMATGCALAAVMLSVMSFDNSTAYYGWFWCGGVCPEEFVSDLGGNYATDDSVAIGAITTQDLTADAIGLGARATTETAIGWSYSAD